MEELVIPEQEVTLVNKNFHFLRLTDEKNPLIPRDKDVKYMTMDFPEDMIELRVIIMGQTMARYRKGENHSELPIYTSLLSYCHVDFEFVFDDSNWSSVEMIKTVKEIDETEEIDIFDGMEYHRGHRVTYKPTVYIGREKRVKIPTITFYLAPPTELKNPKVPVRELVTNIDAEYKTRLEQKYNLTMVDETSGYATNYIYYMGNMAGKQYVF
jgi:hypothetical protein